MTQKLTHCILSTNGVSQADRQSIKEAIATYAEHGLGEVEAEISAIQDVLAQARDERDSILDAIKAQHPAVLAGVSKNTEKPNTSAEPVQETGKTEQVEDDLDSMFDEIMAEETAPKEPVPQPRRGDLFKDGQGNTWEIWNARTSLVEAFPVINGKAKVSRDTGVRFATDERARFANPEARTDYFPIAKEKKPVTPQVLTTAQFNSVIQIAADSIDKLRKSDVARVIEETPATHRDDMASRIKEARRDLADEVDDVMAELEAEAKTPRAKKSPVAAPLKSAAINTGKGLADAIDGLGKLFGGSPGTLGSGPFVFNEATYAKAKPLFQQAIAHFKDAGTDLKEAMRSVIKMVMDKFGAKATENMKPYIVRFMKDVRDGNVEDNNLPDGWTESAPGAMATSKDPVSGGIVDRQIVDGTWFAISNQDSVAPQHGFATRMEAIEALPTTRYTEDSTGETDNESDQRSGTDLERDSQDAETADAMGEEGLLDDGPENERTGEPGVPGAEGTDRLDGGERVSGREAAATGERGDLEIYTGATAVSPGTAGSRVDSGSDSDSFDGPPIEPESTSLFDEVAESGLSLEQAKQEQKRADAQEHRPGLDNIRETLPILTEGQQEDVFKTETRFAVPDGYGILFTNSTGTGKTFSGLGVIKRMASAGKTNILVTVPNDKIAEDWQKSGKLLGLDITALASTKDAGKGIVITTYANFGQNDTLATREWDLVVHDEAHYLAMDKDGTSTLSLRALRALTLHPDGVFARAQMIHADLYAERNALAAQAKMERTSDDERNWHAATATQKKADELSALIREKEQAIKDDVMSRQMEKRPRTLFLSATPFAYEKTVDWANGYLFDYNEGRGDESGEYRSYNAGSNRDQFMMQHFGYRMRYGKLTAPDAKVDSGLMQRQFNTWLKKRGALSGRMLDVKADYDRRFILTESAIGARIDEALQWFDLQRDATEDADRKSALFDVSQILAGKFDYLSRRYLLEAIKAKEVIPHVKEHLAMGRKVVVFHDYKKGGGFNPFDLSTLAKGEEWTTSGDTAGINAVIGEFRETFKDLIASDLFNSSSPITGFQKAFPNVLLFNGDVPKAQRRANVAKFQSDDSGPQVMLVQSAAGKEGISLHDTTGKHQRVLFNLGQPTQPTTAIQQEGRIYRTGQVTDAIFRYLNTGTNWEKWAFATTIATRASAAENLGMGEQARALKDAFISGFEESDNYRAGMEGEGKGGKERDRAANEALTEYDRARAFYFGTQKKTSKTKAQEGADYFATPEPLGLKMMEWADIRPGEAVLEPSAGHGAIARWAPDTAEKTAIEPSMALRPRLAMVFDGKILDHDFESLNVVNKYDAIVMNPPFGSGGKTAIEHLAKAATHLRAGGRIVALIPRGPAADKKFDKWFYEAEERPAKPVYTHPELGPIYENDTLEMMPSPLGGPGLKIAGPISIDKIGGAYYARPKGESKTTGINLVALKAIIPGKRTTSFKPAEGLNLVADVILPTVTFERAGTQVATRVIVIEKGDIPGGQYSPSLADVTDINELFDRLENLSLMARAKPQETEATATTNQGKKSAIAKANEAARANEEKAKEVGAIAASTEDATFEQKGDKIVTNAPSMKYTTKAGKEIEGVLVPNKTMAKAVDAYSWDLNRDGKFFVRLRYIQRPGVSGMESRRADRESFAYNALQELAFEDKAFRYKTSHAGTLQSVMRDVFPGAEYVVESTRADEKTESGADHRYTFKTPDRPAKDGKPEQLGKQFDVFVTKDKVWVDFHWFKPGDQGSRAYAAVANFAFNTRRVFVGDPAGVSPDAIMARTKMMLSSALRHGTTRHLDASPEQERGIPHAMVAPLDWRGNDVEKTRALIHTFLETVHNNAPDIKDYSYDFQKRQFTHDPSGERFHPSRAAFDDALRGGQRGAARIGADSGRAAILIQSLVRGRGGEAGDGGILQAILDYSGSLVSEEGGLKGFLSKTTPANAGVSASGRSLIRRVVSLLFQNEALDSMEGSSNGVSDFGITQTTGPQGERLVSIPADALRASNLNPAFAQGGVEVGRVAPDFQGDSIDAGTSLVQGDSPLNVVGDGSAGISGSLGSDAASLKRTPNSGPVQATKGISDLLIGGPMLAHLKRLVEIPGQRISLVKSDMVFGGNYLKIVNGIIQSIPIDMMNVLVSGKTSANAAFHNHPMFKLLPNSLIENVAFLDDVSGPALAIDSSRFGHDSTSHNNTSRIRLYEGVVKRFIEKFPGASRLSIKVVGGRGELPAHVQASQYAEAIYLDDYGQVFVISDQVSSESRLFQILLHEVVGHFGLARMMGDKFQGMLKLVKNAAKAKKPVTDDTYQPGDQDYATIEAVRLRYPEASEEDVAQEVMARIAETDPGRTLFGYLRAIVRQWLRDTARAIGVKLDMTRAELDDLVAKASWYMRKGDNLTREYQPSGMVAASEKGGESKSAFKAVDTKSAEFKVWFGKSQAVDRFGSPLIVYHGAPDARFMDSDAVFKTMNEKWGGPEEPSKRAFWFAASRQSASSYADPRRAFDYQGSEPGVIPAYLSLQTPLVIDGEGKNWRDAQARGKTRNVIDDARDGGHDGVIIRNVRDDYNNEKRTKATDTFVVFSSNQIKSAEKNTGAFDPSNPSILESRAAVAPPIPTNSQATLGVQGGQAGKQAWNIDDGSKWNDFVWKYQNRYVDLKDTIQAITNAAGIIRDKFNPYLQEELYHKRVATRTTNFFDKEFKPLLVQMRMNGVTREEFEEFLHARHAKEANKLIRDRGGMADGGSGMLDQEAADYLAKIDPDKRKKYESLAKKVDAIIAGTRDTLVEYGLESKETVDEWAKMFANYVPLHREDMAEGTGIGQGFSVRGPASKHRTGSSRKVADILANVAQMRDRAIVRGEKNRVAVALYGLAFTNPNPDVWTVDKAPAKQTLDKNGQIIKAIDPNYKSRENVIVARIKGKDGKVHDRAVVFNERNERGSRMARALKNLDAPQLEGVVAASAMITRYMASMSTQYNPVFVFVNFARDLQSTAFNLSSTPLAGKQAEVTAHALSAIKGIISDLRAHRAGKAPSSKWASLYEEMQMEGGTTGYRDMFGSATERTEEQIEKLLDPDWWAKRTWGKVVSVGGLLKAPEQWLVSKPGAYLMNWLSDMNETAENAMRLAVYKTALDHGISVQQAASLAKNITVNFNRKGNSGSQMNALYAFFNAAVQGTSRLTETLQGPAGKQIIAGGIMLGVLQAIALAAAGLDDDDPPEFVREKALIIPFGLVDRLMGEDKKTASKKFITIPMPLGLHVLPNIGRIPTELALRGFKDKGKAATALIGTILEAFNPIGSAGISLQTLSPTPIDPLVALAENKAWTGKKIYREDFDNTDPTPGFTRTKDTASPFSKLLAEVLNKASGGTDFAPGLASPTPDQIDYLLGQATGGVGREALKAWQTGEAITSGEDLPTHKMPLVGRFYGEATGQRHESEKFYENLTQLNIQHNEIKGRRGDGEDVNQFLQEHPEARLYKAAEKTQREIGFLRRQKRKLLEEGASRADVKQIEERITFKMKRLNDAVASSATSE